jgi:amidase
MTDICFTPARKLASQIRSRKLSATEVMKAFIAQIERVNPKVNAIVTFLPEQALAAAKKFDKNFKANKARPLAGLPIAYKDNVPTKGIRTTSGSPIYKDNVPTQDHLIVERLTAAGAITLGKTNLPEFAAGSHTFNLVFGATLNPYDLGRSAGGSSGGAAAAVASGMLPFADGGDLAASLRNPGNFCNVVGFRPTPGRVPHWPAPNAWNSLGVLGPIARTAADAAFLLSAMAGPDRRAPLSIAEPGKVFSASLARSFKKTRIAWSRNLGGLPVDPRVTAVLEKQRKGVQGPRLHRGGSGTRFLGRHRVLRDDARGVLRAELRRAGEDAAARGEGLHQVERRAGPQARAGADRARRQPAQRALPAHARLPRALRVPALPGEPAVRRFPPRSSTRR